MINQKISLDKVYIQVFTHWKFCPEILSESGVKLNYIYINHIIARKCTKKVKQEKAQ